MLQPYLKKYTQISYFNNEKDVGRLGTPENRKRCFNLASGEHINFLNDDDVFYPKKIES